MKFANEELRNKLAAEYVLGTMSARARRRFEINLKENPALRRAVAEWEKRLTPLALALPAVEPPSRVWHAIESRIRGGGQARPSFWESLSFWRFSSIASGLVALALLILVAVPGPVTPRFSLPRNFAAAGRSLQRIFVRILSITFPARQREEG